MNGQQSKCLISNLSALNIFKKMSKEDLFILEKYGQWIELEKNAAVLLQGTPGKGLFVLICGKARAFIRLLGKGEIHLKNFSAGDFFGEISMIEDELCTASVFSQQKSLYFFLSNTVYSMLSVFYPHIAYQLNQQLVKTVIFRQFDVIKKIKILEEGRKKRKTIFLGKMKLSEKSKIKKIKWSAKRKLNYFHYLKGLDFFFNMNMKSFQDFITLSNIIQVPSHTSVIQEKISEAIDSNVQDEFMMFFILKGAIQIGIKANQKRIKVTVLGPNSFLCLIKLVDNLKELYRYDSCEDTLLLALSKKDFESLSKNNPELFYYIKNRAARYVLSLQNKLNAQLARTLSEEKGKD